MSGESLYTYEIKRADGSVFTLEPYKDKVLLIVNTASKCGFTPQYAGLEALHKKYMDRGLVVLGFPCDQFAHQEPGGDEEIQSFCVLNFGVTFPVMAKIEVNGPGAHPLFSELRKRTKGLLGDSVRWNFTKFLVSPGAKTVKRYAPTFEPEKMEADIDSSGWLK
ncbi:MAG: glutathione peroxidase [Spirochaetes bacterium]|nr:MAG: glutathione peroxidase [Spirochaetota bacterium]